MRSDAPSVQVGTQQEHSATLTNVIDHPMWFSTAYDFPSMKTLAWKMHTSNLVCASTTHHNGIGRACMMSSPCAVWNIATSGIGTSLILMRVCQIASFRFCHGYTPFPRWQIFLDTPHAYGIRTGVETGLMSSVETG